MRVLRLLKCYEGEARHCHANTSLPARHCQHEAARNSEDQTPLIIVVVLGLPQATPPARLTLNNFIFQTHMKDSSVFV